MLNYFDPNLKTEVIYDASPYGLSAILFQHSQNENEKKMIAYASRSLTETEQRYSQIEREALAILFGCRKFQIYVLGRHFKIITDHKPLLSMFNNPRSQAPFRIERIRLKLQGFCYTVEHISGVSNHSDYLSRHSISANKRDLRDTKDLEAYVNYIFHPSVIEPAVSIDDIKEALKKDKIALKLKISIKNGTLDKNDLDLRCFSKIFNELSIVKGLIVRGNHIYIPDSLRKTILRAAHEGHQGIVKTKQFLRDKVWYPQIDRDIENSIQNCIACQASTLKNCKEPLKMTELPSGPWEHVAVDFKGPVPSGEYLLVVIDEYSRFAEIEITRSTSMKSAIPKLDKNFLSFGIPVKVRSDNGSPFSCDEFDKYAKYLGFVHKTITLEYPQANGLVENFNKMIGKVLRTASVEHKNWKQELYKFLCNYRATPHMTTGKPPSEIIFPNRKFKTRIPDFIDDDKDVNDEEIHNKDTLKKSKTKYYADKRNNAKRCNIKVGDKVIVRKRRKNKSSPYYDPKPYVVTKKKGNMIVAGREDHTITRNCSFFKKIMQNPYDEYSDYEEIKTESKEAEMNIPLRQSTRSRRMPQRYENYEMF